MNNDEEIWMWSGWEDSNDSSVGSSIKLNKLEQDYTPLRGLVSLSKEAFKCEDCGVVTSDWSAVSPKLQTCVCNKCTTRRHISGNIKDDHDW